MHIEAYVILVHNVRGPVWSSTIHLFLKMRTYVEVEDSKKIPINYMLTA